VLDVFAAAAASPAAYIARLDGWVGRGIAAAGNPGAALVVVDDRGVVHCRGFGVDADGRPVTCRTRFAIASLTKSVTALEIVVLAQRGRVDLRAPARTYLPWFRTADARASARITLDDLLTQRSGFTEATGRAQLASGDDDPGALERRVRALASARLASEPGTAFAYSNANYDVLGAVIGAVRSTPYENAVREDVLAPLGLDGARFTRGDPPLAGFARIFGLPVRARNAPAIRGDAPAAGLVVDAMTYGRYLAAHLDAGRTWSAAVAAPDAWARAHRSPADSPYAMGWYEDAGPELHQLRHAGSAPDFSSYAIFFPERRIGAALLANANASAGFGRSDWLETGIERILTDREPPRAPPFPLDVIPRLGATAGLLLLIASIVAGLRDRSKRAASVRLVTALAVLVILPLAALPQMGWSLAVGFLYGPDITVLFGGVLCAAAAAAALAALQLVRG
jgi:CubicO group peptidase (beta-lactamase class C family)